MEDIYKLIDDINLQKLDNLDSRVNDALTSKYRVSPRINNASSLLEVKASFTRESKLSNF
jgi:hypothetical protein